MHDHTPIAALLTYGELGTLASGAIGEWGRRMDADPEDAGRFLAAAQKAQRQAEFKFFPNDQPRPRIVCLCGSTRFKQAFIEANFRETMAGRIVLSVGWYSHADAVVYRPSAEEKAALDELHLCKIDLADEVLAINVGGYIGESTRRELIHARSLGKPIRWQHPDLIPAEFAEPRVEDHGGDADAV